MQFEQLNGGPLTDAEKVYAAVRNISGGTLSAGAAAFFVVASPDGISVSNAGTSRKWTFAGILPAAITDSAYGRAQVYGIGSAYVVLNDSSVSAIAGQQCNVVNSAAYLKDYVAADVFTAVSSAVWSGGNPWNHVTLMSAIASGVAASAPQLKPVFIRAL